MADPAWSQFQRMAGGCGWQMAQRRTGKGVAVWLQIDPERFDADTRTYFRFTRWRQMRAVAQVLANLGATLRDDIPALQLTPRPPVVVPLAGKWQYAITANHPSATGPDILKDRGISAAARVLLDGKEMIAGAMTVPGPVPGFDTRDGEAVVRRTIGLPASYAGRDLTLDLGKVDDFDVTFWNGQQIGITGTEIPSSWTANRRYTIPGHLVKAGKNVLAIRIWDWYGGGGLFSPAPDMTLRLTGGVAAFLYHPDYRTDLFTGDDPFHYKRR